MVMVEGPLRHLLDSLAEEDWQKRVRKMAYTEELISFWVWRNERKAHLVESVINGELVTNCGKHLRTEGWQPADPPYVDPDEAPPGMYCQVCS